MFYWKQGSLMRKIKLGLVHAEGEGAGQGGNGSEVWYKDMPEDMQAWDEVKNAKTPEDYHKYVANMRGFMGQSIRVPGEDAGKEDWDKFNEKMISKVPTLMQKPDLENKEVMDQVYASLGCPEKTDGYKTPEIEGADMSAAEGFKNIAHKYKLNPTQYDGIVKEFTQTNLQAAQEAEQANKDAHKELQKEWGNEYNNRMSLATNIAKLTDAPPELVEIFKSGRADPASYKWMYNLSQKFKGEGANLLNDDNDQKTGLSPSEAAARIAEIRGNKEHPYFDKANPGHKAAQQLMKELYEAKIAG